MTVSAGPGDPAGTVRAQLAALVEEKVGFLFVDLAQEVPVGCTKLRLQRFHDLLHGRSVLGGLRDPLVQSVQSRVLDHICDELAHVLVGAVLARRRVA